MEPVKRSVVWLELEWEVQRCLGRGRGLVALPSVLGFGFVFGVLDVCPSLDEVRRS